jgi:AcrR family transcriptional regulator
MNQNAQHPGRPRDARVDDALLRAGFEVFLERGYHAATLTEIARRAKVGTPAIYRRWPNKTDMAIAIVVMANLPEPILDTGSIRDDLVTFMRLRLKQWRTPLFAHVMMPVILEATTDKRLAEQIRETLIGYRAPMAARIRRSVASGELRGDTEPNRLIDLLMGTVTMPLLFSQDLPRQSEAEHIVGQVLEGFATRKRSRTPVRVRGGNAVRRT